jgi:hypothetical protein
MVIERGFVECRRRWKRSTVTTAGVVFHEFGAVLFLHTRIATFRAGLILLEYKI